MEAIRELRIVETMAANHEVFPTQTAQDFPRDATQLPLRRTEGIATIAKREIDEMHVLRQREERATFFRIHADKKDVIAALRKRIG